MHEVVFSAKNQKQQGVSALDIAKRLIDYGIHPPTMYFPLIVEEALMIEPTETESKETIDNFIHVMQTIAQEVLDDPSLLKNAPYGTPNTRLDDLTKPFLLKGNKNSQSWKISVNKDQIQQGVFLNQLWAREKVESLRFLRTIGFLDQISYEEKVVELALQHQLVTKFTSLVAVDENISRNSDETIYSHQISQNIPEGWIDPNVIKKCSKRVPKVFQKGSKSVPEVSRKCALAGLGWLGWVSQHWAGLGWAGWSWAGLWWGRGNPR